MIGVVVLAAGESRRMGEPKPLLKIKGKRMIEWVVNSFRGVAEEIIVVLGYKPEVIKPVLEKLGVRWVVNENYREGMVSSFKEGLRELENCDAVFLALGDQPFVDKDYLANAIDAWKRGAKVVSPVHRGKKGHPVLFDQSLFGEILSLQKHEMIRDIIHRYCSGLRLVEAGEWAIIDIDSPEDFHKILKK